jgi:hypothetical protein
MIGNKYWTHRTSTLYLLNFIKQIIPLDLDFNNLCRYIFSGNNIIIIHKSYSIKTKKQKNMKMKYEK